MMNQQHPPTAPDRDAVCPRCWRPLGQATISEITGHQRAVYGHCCACDITAETQQIRCDRETRWAVQRYRIWADLGEGMRPGRWLRFDGKPAAGDAATAADNAKISVSDYLANIHKALDTCMKSIRALEIVMRHEEESNHGSA